MARIRREDVEHVREHCRIDEVVAQHVTLKTAGVGSQKGLCPFHDERTPSFHVRPEAGYWHCFGCDQGGDVISFVEKIEHLGFTDAVHLLADRIGFQLRLEDDGQGPARQVQRQDRIGQRQRLVEANRHAAAFFREQLAGAEATPARQFLVERGFDRLAADHFGVGYAPRQGEALVRHLRSQGVVEEDLITSGLAAQGQRGPYDRFRGRLVWPIRDVTGEVVGFGARRIFDDDRIEAKYLNTPETPLYKKSQVLYGVDLAKRDIAQAGQVVVVEGYTDVMACHLAGVTTAVATCGTSFGEEHIRVVRRLLGDDGTRGTRVVFTFDGDAAGQKAAMRAFADEQKFVAQTFVAVAQDGMDPCDLRQRHGAEAVRALVGTARPMYEFAITSVLQRFDLDTAEGRAAALRATAPSVAGIRDRTMRDDYARQLAGWLAVPERDVLWAVRRAGQGAPAAAAETPVEAAQVFDGRDPVARNERDALQCVLQVPHFVPAEFADTWGDSAFEVPSFRVLHQAVRAAGGLATAQKMPPQAWAQSVLEEAPESVRTLVQQLIVAPLPADDETAVSRHAAAVVLRVSETEMTRLIATLRSRVQRLQPGDAAHDQAYVDLLTAETRRRALRDRINGQ